MHSHAWLIAIFLGFFAFSSQVHGQNSDQPPAVNDRGNIVETLSIPIKIVEDQETVRHKTEELSIQRSMEKSALWAVYAAIASAILVGLGTILLIRTLYWTRKANEAAQAAVRVTREVARDQSRAYVHVDKAELTWGNWSAERPNIMLTAINNGQSPAKWFDLACVCIGSKTDETAPQFSRTIISSRKFSRWHSFAAGGILTFRGTRSEEDIKSLKNAYGSPSMGGQSDIVITVYGTIRYCTIFDEILESEFFFQRCGVPKYYESLEASPGQEMEFERMNEPVKGAIEVPIKIPKAPCQDLHAYTPVKIEI